MPRVKTDADRGWIGSWLRKQRIQRGLSSEQVIDLLPQPIRVDYYRGLEAGRKPGPELLAAFEDLYGPLPAEPAAEVGPEDVDRVRMEALGALTVALEAQAEAMRALALEMRELRESTLGQSAGLGAALGALAETLESLKPALIGRSR